MVPERIRNVALVGHGGSGKTSLAEALLYVAGATTRQGSVDDGTTILDFEPEEVDRKISLGISVATVEWNGHRINLIDTPGYADFSGEARSALHAADLALFVVSAVDGVEVQHEVLWKFAEEENIPRAVIVTKLDRERASFSSTLEQLRTVFGKRIAPIQVPIGSEVDLVGMARVVTGKVFTYPDGAKRGVETTDLEESVKAMVDEAHTALIESVVETDDELMMAYFDGEEPSREIIVETVHNGMLAGEIYPVLVASAPKLVGVDMLAEFLVDFGPNPLEHSTPPLDSGSLEVSKEGNAVAYVFKTISDPYVGRISLFRVFSGSIKQDDTLEVPGSGTVRMHNLFRVQGKEHMDVTEVITGDIAAVAKVDGVATGATLRSPGSDVLLSPVEYPAPVMELAVTPHSNQDEEKLSSAMQRATDEDPTLRVERRPETGETILAGLGDVHLDVTLARISRKYGVEVDTSLPRVPYRETITATAEAEGKHKKQSGGRGQFGVAFVRFAPRPRGSGYEFIDSIKGGSIPRQFIPAVDKGVHEALERGIVAGYPVVDVAAEVYDGKYHSVDSDELSFRMAGIAAVRTATSQLRPVILEPIMRMTIRVPEEQTGDIIGDINSKRGRVLGMDTDGSLRVINAEVPMGEVQRYAVDLRSMTGGRGSFEMAFDHYEEMPHSEAQKVIAAAERDGD